MLQRTTHTLSSIGRHFFLLVGGLCIVASSLAAPPPGTPQSPYLLNFSLLTPSRLQAISTDPFGSTTIMEAYTNFPNNWDFESTFALLDSIRQHLTDLHDFFVPGIRGKTLKDFENVVLKLPQVIDLDSFLHRNLEESLQLAAIVNRQLNQAVAHPAQATTNPHLFYYHRSADRLNFLNVRFKAQDFAQGKFASTLKDLPPEIIFHYCIPSSVLPAAVTEQLRQANEEDILVRDINWKYQLYQANPYTFKKAPYKNNDHFNDPLPTTRERHQYFHASRDSSSYDVPSLNPHCVDPQEFKSDTLIEKRREKFLRFIEQRQKVLALDPPDETDQRYFDAFIDALKTAMPPESVWGLDEFLYSFDTDSAYAFGPAAEKILYTPANLNLIKAFLAQQGAEIARLNTKLSSYLPKLRKLLALIQNATGTTEEKYALLLPHLRTPQMMKFYRDFSDFLDSPRFDPQRPHPCRKAVTK